MKNFSTIGIYLIIALMVGIIGCGGGANVNMQPAEKPSPAGDEVQMPDGWGDNDPDAVLGRGIAVSSDMQTAIDKADLIAGTDLGANVERWVTNEGFLRVEDRDKWATINSTGKSGDNVDKSFNSERQQVVDQILRGTERVINKVYREGSQFRAYIKLALPIGMANKALREEIEKRAEMKELYKDTQAKKRLDDAVKALEERKAKEGQ